MTVSVAPAIASSRRHAGAVAHIRPVQHGAVEPRRLERIVAAFGRQRAADKDNVGETVKEAELAHRVGEIDIGFVVDRLATGAPRNSQPCGGEHRGDIVAARGMAGNDDRQQIAIFGRNQMMNAGGDLLLPGMRTGGEPKGTRSDRSAQLRQLGEVDWQRRGRRFEIAEQPPCGGRPASGTAATWRSSWARHRSKASSIGRINPGQRCQRR